MAVRRSSAACATWSASWRTSDSVRAVTITSWERRSSCSVTIKLPGRVAQVSWITRFRSLLALRQACSAASTASLAAAVRPV